MTPVATPISEALRILADGRSLTADQGAAAFAALVSGTAPPADAAALLMGLKRKGESAAEIAGAAAALRREMVVLAVEDADRCVDTCGTGGGLVGTLNISTAAAFLAVGAGVRVAKHGNRSHTSRSGSADVLEALGIQVELPPDQALAALDASGFTFMYAPLYHPAMRHVAAVRRELGVPTLMNLLGPLANPAQVGRQVIGAAEPRVAPLMAAAIAALGTRHTLVVHAKAGMDEISPLGPTEVWEVRDGQVERWTIHPEDHGQAVLELDSLAGGEPAENAARIEQLLGGGEGDEAVRAAVILNAGAAVYVAGLESEYSRAVERAQAALARGAGAEVLARVRAAAPRSPIDGASTSG